MRTLFALTLAVLCFGLGVNIVNAAPVVTVPGTETYIEGVGGPSGLPVMSTIVQRTKAVGWPHRPIKREMRQVVRVVLRDYTAGAGPRVRGGINCNFGPKMGSFVYCTIVLQYRQGGRTVQRTYFARYKFYEDGSSRVEYDGA